jgi:hypothetical protein
MPTYIMLSTLTPEGVQTVKNNPNRIKEVNKEIEQIGAKVVAQWATLGQFDFVNGEAGYGYHPTPSRRGPAACAGTHAQSGGCARA